MSCKKILIIDDEESFTRLLKTNLESTQAYEVRAENWAPRGLMAAQEFKPDLILLDVMMPGLDGGEVASRLQASPRTSNIPIIFLTAAVKPEEVGSRGGFIGGFPYLAKPVDMDGVIACIENVLLERQTPGAEQQL
jgi:two-component system, OmpR family, response regulator